MRSRILMLFGMIATPLTAFAQRSDSWSLGPFREPKGVNPIITPDPATTFRSPANDSLVHWEEYATFNPAAVARHDTVFLIYRAEDSSGDREIGHHTSRLGLAASTDGIHFTRRSEPVLFPARDDQAKYESPGGVEDPRIVETEDGTYVLTYTQWNRDIPRLAVATSNDLVHWQKHGPAFARAAGGKYLAMESKSGAIVVRRQGQQLVAAKIAGKYWMYYGVPNIHLATSDNLTDWTPLEDDNGNALNVLSPRPGYFDSWLVEAGPPALLMHEGIVVLYNAGNAEHNGASGLSAHVYTGGQALFDARNPVKLLRRLDRPFIAPTAQSGKGGQYKEGTTFVESLVPFRGQWFVYFGRNDSGVGVAIAPAR